MTIKDDTFSPTRTGASTGVRIPIGVFRLTIVTVIPAS
jgi:hypothetical protein